MMHVLGIHHEEFKRGTFKFPDLDIPQSEFPDVALQETLEDLLENPRVEDTG